MKVFNFYVGYNLSTRIHYIKVTKVIIIMVTNLYPKADAALRDRIGTPNQDAGRAGNGLFVRGS